MNNHLKELIVNWIGVLCAASLAAALIVLAITTDPEWRAERVRDEAVRRGVAERVELPDGTWDFQWITEERLP